MAWKDDVYFTIENDVTMQHFEWHVDQIWEANPSLLTGYKHVDKRGVGAVLKEAEENGLIVNTGGFRRSTRKGNNATLGVVWQSVHYKKPTPK